MIRKLVVLCAIAGAAASGLRAYEDIVGKKIVPESCSYSSTCTVSGVEGVCVSISAGCCSGTVTSNKCSGSSDIKCCTKNPCTTPQGSGTCIDSSTCSGTSYGGYCTGPSNIQCCVTKGPSPSPSPPSPSPTKSTYGIDLYPATSVSTYQCMISSGYTFVVARGYRSSGQVDTNVCTNIKNAKSAGMSSRDTYIFPCPTCSSSASSQVNALVSYINSNCKSEFNGKIWLDIENTGWTSSTSTNKSFYQQLVDACNASGYGCGVYTNKSNWEEIFGSSSYEYGNSLPLWYAHYDNKASFSDFTAFAGWSSPYAKQYAGDVTLCSTDVDKNYSPYW